MQRIAFREPVVIWLDRRKKAFGTKRIEDVQGGLTALHRFGLGECRLDERGRPREEWALAAAALLRARTDPTPENIEAARRALCGVAVLARALAPKVEWGISPATLGLWRDQA